MADHGGAGEPPDQRAATGSTPREMRSTIQRTLFGAAVIASGAAKGPRDTPNTALMPSMPWARKRRRLRRAFTLELRRLDVMARQPMLVADVEPATGDHRMR